MLQVLAFGKIRWKFGTAERKKERERRTNISGADSNVTAVTTFSLLNLCIDVNLPITKATVRHHAVHVTISLCFSCMCGGHTSEVDN